MISSTLNDNIPGKTEWQKGNHFSCPARHICQHHHPHYEGIEGNVGWWMGFGSSSWNRIDIYL